MGNGPGPTPLVVVTEQAMGHTWDLPLDDSFALPSPIESEGATDEDWLWGIDQTVRAMDAQPSETNAASGVGAGVVEVAQWVPRSRVPAYVLAMEAAKHASETPRGLGKEEWTLPSESSTDDLDGETMAEMDEVDVEFEEEIETEADVDDDTAMASTVLKKEERGEEEEYKAKEAWWVQITCLKAS